MAKIDGLEIVMTKQMQKMIDKELKKRFEELKPELATRYEELLNMRNMEINQFNDGFNDARAGKLETDHPHYDFDTDNWRLGYAWGMFETMKEKLAREHQVSDALYLLLVDDPNTKLKADQILIDIYGKCEPSPSDVSVTQDVTTPEPPEDALNARIAELEEAQRWIPVGERLPEERQNVLALDKTGTAYHWEYSRSLSNIFVSIYTHWMPLPELPEVKE